jgi:alkanesulfonate monooxygenase SsuD/methylene tetrahydromethanopterin reductase-like flavin-dependent oxidoreductase (luciferase family)
VTSSWGGRRYLSYVFTQEEVAREITIWIENSGQDTFSLIFFFASGNPQ